MFLMSYKNDYRCNMGMDWLRVSKLPNGITSKNSLADQKQSFTKAILYGNVHKKKHRFTVSIRSSSSAFFLLFNRFPDTADVNIKFFSHNACYICYIYMEYIK